MENLLATIHVAIVEDERRTREGLRELIEGSEGFLGLRQMINRATGEGLVGTVWTDAAAMEAAAKTADERRALGESRGIKFGDQTKREILFVDLA